MCDYSIIQESYHENSLFLQNKTEYLIKLLENDLDWLNEEFNVKLQKFEIGHCQFDSLHFSLLIKNYKLFQYYLEHTEVNQFHLNLAELNNNYVFMKELLLKNYGTNKQAISNYFLQQNLIMKYALKGEELSLISIFVDFFKEDFNQMYYNEKIFSIDEENSKQNIFHIIAYFSMTKFLPILLDFLKDTIYSNNDYQLKQQLKELLEEENYDKATPIQIAISNQFYELLFIAQYFEIDISFINEKFGKANTDLRPRFNRFGFYTTKDLSKFSDYNYYILLKQSLELYICLLYTSPSPRDRQKSRMPSSA
eukprot:TRINITY_DN9161_c0_g1_i3.p1 TRINITY_DN9161_c0_g1~~TRINITY_DN9161_c0_g1_i3.p1  ORF type:complete len:309 (+),score=47.71 TRINITY_DN9161_c0_g1_i3:279-1205(+)